MTAVMTILPKFKQFGKLPKDSYTYNTDDVLAPGLRYAGRGRL